jgi:hypothetical protein
MVLRSPHDVDLGAYLTVLGRLHAELRPRTYLEIGVETGASLRLARAGTRSVGIDPDPQLLYAFDPTSTAVIRATSDAFFQAPLSRAMFRGDAVDLAFLDGMHLFEHTLRDFINVERRSHEGSAIVMHDCLPIDRVTAARERTTDVWTGDVWKVVWALRRHRPDLHVVVCDVEPSGLAIVTGLDPTSTVLADRYHEIVAELMPLDCFDVGDDPTIVFGAVESSWSTLRQHLPPGFPPVVAPARPFVVIADGAEVVANPAILAAWVAAGTGLDGVTFAVSVASRDAETVAMLLEEQVAALDPAAVEAVDLDVAFFADDDEDARGLRILRSADLVLAERTPPGVLALVARIGIADLPVLSTLIRASRGTLGS